MKEDYQQLLNRLRKEISTLNLKRHKLNTEQIEMLSFIEGKSRSAQFLIDTKVIQLTRGSRKEGLEHILLSHYCYGCNGVLTAREIMNIGRVIARPFVGEKSGEYERTGNRHDYSVLPPSKTLLDNVKDTGGQVVSIGKIADIFANQGITKQVKATGLEELFDNSLAEFKKAPAGSIVFTNFVDFDSLY
jgi:phosphopentomutase